MAKPTDAIGNELAVGDMIIHVQGDAQMYGFVTDISESSIVTPGGGQDRPGIVTVSYVPSLLAYDQKSPKPTRFVGITKVVKPPQLPPHVSKMGQA